MGVNNKTNQYGNDGPSISNPISSSNSATKPYLTDWTKVSQSEPLKPTYHDPWHLYLSASLLLFLISSWKVRESVTFSFHLFGSVFLSFFFQFFPHHFLGRGIKGSRVEHSSEFLHLLVCPSICTFIHLSVPLFVHPSVHPSVHPFLHLFVHPSISPSLPS